MIVALYDVRAGAFRDDPWSFPADDAALPEGKAAVSKARLLARGEAAAGLVLSAGDTLGDIDPARFELIALRFPRYADGRPYSMARCLRERHGFAGELRATGDVLRDQIGFLIRAGFDTLDIAHPGTIDALRAGTLVRPDLYYQPGAGSEAAAGYSWRRARA
ncbi:MAG: DUF934 domain-containing protein [Tagaea sp.]